MQTIKLSKSNLIQHLTSWQAIKTTKQSRSLCGCYVSSTVDRLTIEVINSVTKEDEFLVKFGVYW